MTRPPPSSTLFPYTTLFRSLGQRHPAHRRIEQQHRDPPVLARPGIGAHVQDRKSTRLNSSHLGISYAVFCLKKKKTIARNYPGGPPAAAARDTPNARHGVPH